MNANSIALPDLHRAALDALPDAVFVWTVDTDQLRPLNHVARQLSGQVKSVPATFQECFPETNLSRLRETPERWILTRFVSQPAGPSSEVALQARNLEHSDRDRVLLLVRPLVSGSPGSDVQSLDAFDDAYHDPLTRLANRRLFQRRLQRAIERAGRGYEFAVLFVDLDDFKGINDRFGHLCGDRVLIGAARRLVESVRPQDMVARRDGDEFTILLDDLEQPDDAVNVADRIVQHFQSPLSLHVDGRGIDVTLGVSIGITTSREGGLDADSLLSRADAAMYRAKEMGGSTYFSSHELPLAEIPATNRSKPLPR